MKALRDVPLKTFPGLRRDLGAAAFFLVLALLLLGAPAESQPRIEEEAPAHPFELCELKAELMARLAVEAPDAVPLAEKVLELSAQWLGPKHPEIAIGMAHLAYAHQLAGEVQQSRSLFELALDLAEKLLGPEHPTTAMVLSYLAALQHEQGELEGARQRLERALAIQERVVGPDSPEAALALNSLGNLLHSMGELAGARAHLIRALEILQERLGSEHVETATVINNLAMVLLEMGDLKGAHSLMNRALAVNARHFGFEHPTVAVDLSNLCRVLYEIGDLGNARRRCEQALRIFEKTLPGDHPSIAAALINLGSVLNALGLHKEAEEHLSRALSIQTLAFGDEYPQLGCTLGSLGSALRSQGETAKAQEYFERAVEIRQQQPAPGPRLGAALNNRACSLISLGDPEAALPELRKAVELAEKYLGPDHPDRVTALINLATTLDAVEQPEEAVELTARALDLEERALVAMVGLGALEETEQFLDRISWNSSWAVSLHVRSAPHSPAAVRLGLTTVLRRKGRDLEAYARPYGALDDPEADELMAALRRTREARAFLELHSAEPSAGDRAREWCRLTDRLRLLSSELRKVHKRLGEPPPEISIEAVRKRIPDRAVLVEFFLFQPIETRPERDPAEDTAPRYLAYVLHRQGEPDWVDLGDAETIDLRVDALRESLTKRRDDVIKHAQHLDQVTMARVRQHFRDVDTILLSPDGTLNLVPFAALVDEEDSYLVERYQLSYLSTGRDLLRDQATPSREPSLVLGAPEFGSGPGPWSLGGGFESVVDFEDLSFQPLPGAAQEAKLIAATLGLEPERILIGAAAREGAIKGVRGPRILHLATHGFFLGDPTPEPVELPTCLEGPSSLDPLLRSGLALSGVPRDAATASEDGILTAAEVIDLDLSGTEIVTLSACETGVGEVRPGRGVYGLRRALVLAGARTQVMSLWRVPDRATAALMTSWYAQLKEGLARGEALRQVQLALLRGEPLPVTGERGLKLLSPTAPADSQHPYFWASFILVGDTGPLPGNKQPEHDPVESRLE